MTSLIKKLKEQKLDFKENYISIGFHTENDKQKTAIVYNGDITVLQRFSEMIQEVISEVIKSKMN